MIVDRPRDYDGDGGEEAGGCWIDAHVAPGWTGVAGTGNGHHGVARGGEKSVEDNESAAGAVAVGEIGCYEYDEEGG